MCVYSLIKRLEAKGFPHTKAVATAWEIEMGMDKMLETPNWDAGNLDDPSRAKDTGFEDEGFENKKGKDKDDKKKPDEKDKSCESQNEAKGMSKEKASEACSKSAK